MKRTCACVHTYMRARTQRHTCAHMHAHTHAQTCTRMHTTHMHTIRVHTHARAHMRMHTHTCSHTACTGEPQGLAEAHAGHGGHGPQRPSSPAGRAGSRREVGSKTWGDVSSTVPPRLSSVALLSATRPRSRAGACSGGRVSGGPQASPLRDLVCVTGEWVAVVSWCLSQLPSEDCAPARGAGPPAHPPSVTQGPHPRTGMGPSGLHEENVHPVLTGC